jgi:hypothetical protein
MNVQPFHTKYKKWLIGTAVPTILSIYVNHVYSSIKYVTVKTTSDLANLIVTFTHITADSANNLAKKMTHYLENNKDKVVACGSEQVADILSYYSQDMIQQIVNNEINKHIKHIIRQTKLIAPTPRQLLEYPKNYKYQTKPLEFNLIDSPQKVDKLLIEHHKSEQKYNTDLVTYASAAVAANTIHVAAKSSSLISSFFSAITQTDTPEQITASKCNSLINDLGTIYKSQSNTYKGTLSNELNLQIHQILRAGNDAYYDFSQSTRYVFFGLMFLFGILLLFTITYKACKCGRNRNRFAFGSRKKSTSTRRKKSTSTRRKKSTSPRRKKSTPRRKKSTPRRKKSTSPRRKKSTSPRRKKSPSSRRKKSQSRRKSRRRKSK